MAFSYTYSLCITVVYVVLGVSACGVVESGDQAAPAPVVSEQAKRIVGGQTFTGLPAVGALTRYGSHHCTGTLVAPRKVLTAAHCVRGQSASALRFVIGPSIYSAQATLSVVSLHPHPSYNSSALTNDIAYVTLGQDAPVAPMKVLTAMSSAWAGRSLFFVGYGVTSGYSGSGAGTKRAVTMRIASVASTKFTYNDSGRNTCGGDSGGPAFFVDSAGTYHVAGVTSYGDQYCTSYGVDTRVDPYIGWLGLNTSTTPTPAPAPSDPCNGETYKGRCSGQTVVWCESNKVYQQDCAGASKVCGLDTSAGYYACLTPAAPADPCQGETFAGRCSGSTVIWCESNKVQSVNCATTYGKSCGWSSSKGYYACM